MTTALTRKGQLGSPLEAESIGGKFRGRGKLGEKKTNPYFGRVRLFWNWLLDDHIFTLDCGFVWLFSILYTSHSFEYYFWLVFNVSANHELSENGCRSLVLFIFSSLGPVVNCNGPLRYSLYCYGRFGWLSQRIFLLTPFYFTVSNNALFTQIPLWAKSHVEGVINKEFWTELNCKLGDMLCSIGGSSQKCSRGKWWIQNMETWQYFVMTYVFRRTGTWLIKVYNPAQFVYIHNEITALKIYSIYNELPWLSSKNVLIILCKAKWLNEDSIICVAIDLARAWNAFVFRLRSDCCFWFWRVMDVIRDPLVKPNISVGNVHFYKLLLFNRNVKVWHMS